MGLLLLLSDHCVGPPPTVTYTCIRVWFLVLVIPLLKGTAGSYSHTVLTSWWAPQQRFPLWLPQFALPPARHQGSRFSTLLSILVTFHVLIIATLTSVKWHLIVVFICISLMTNDGEHVVMYFLAICTSSWEKYLFKSFVHFSIGGFLLWSNGTSASYTLHINPLSGVWVAYIFSYSVGYRVILDCVPWCKKSF